MQTQKEFIREMKKTINKLMGKNYKAEVHPVEKLNIGTIHALIISSDSSNVSPSFCIEGLYEDYQRGEATIKEMAENIVNTYFHNKKLSTKENEFSIHLGNEKWIRKRLFLQLINGSKNKKLLKDSIHMDFNELSLVLYVMAAANENGIAKVRITKAMLDNFGWNEKNILNYALKNTIRLFPYKESTIYECLQKNYRMQRYDYFREHRNDCVDEWQRYQWCYNCLLSWCVKRNSRKVCTNLFLLPSSIHEFIILKDDNTYKSEELKDMVKTVNGSIMLLEEVLSDSIYYYKRNSNVLSVFKNGKLKKIAKL